MEIQGNVGRFLRNRWFLGRYGKPICHLWWQLYWVRMVGIKTDLGQRIVIQRLQDRSLLPSLWYTTFFAGSCTGLQDRERAFRSGTFQSCRRGCLFPCMDHNSVDTSIQRCTLCEPGWDLLQSKSSRRIHLLHGRGASWQSVRKAWKWRGRCQSIWSIRDLHRKRFRVQRIWAVICMCSRSGSKTAQKRTFCYLWYLCNDVWWYRYRSYCSCIRWRWCECWT